MERLESAKEALSRLGITATTPRLVIADILFERQEHPTAREILRYTQERLPVVAPATVYNTLNLFVEHGFIHELRLGDEGSVRYDINTDPHHHLLDKESGQVLDLPFDSVQISNLEELEREYSLKRISVTIEGKNPSSLLSHAQDNF